MRGGRGRARRGRGGRAAAEDVLVAKALERAAAQAKAARRRSAPSRGARSAVMRAKAAVARTAEELEVEEVRAAVPQGAATPLATALPASRRAAAAVDRRLGGAVVGVLVETRVAEARGARLSASARRGLARDCPRRAAGNAPWNVYKWNCSLSRPRSWCCCVVVLIALQCLSSCFLLSLIIHLTPELLCLLSNSPSLPFPSLSF